MAETKQPPRCPVCGKPAAEATRPFCGKRCADVDLGRWFTGQYRVPGVARTTPRKTLRSLLDRPDALRYGLPAPLALPGQAARLGCPGSSVGRACD